MMESTSSHISVSRIFEMSDQLQFADLSGDVNPLHVDVNEARRLLYGQPVVHGIHGVLWALEQCPNLPIKWTLSNLEVEFLAPIFLNEKVELVCDQDKNRLHKITLKSNGSVVTKLSFQVLRGDQTVLLWSGGEESPHQECKVLGFENLGNAKGQLYLSLPSKQYTTMFPRLSGTAHSYPIATLLASTRLVGMECPGWNSLYNGLRLSFQRDCAGHDSVLNYEVTKRYASMPLLKIGIAGSHFDGEITCSERPAPAVQPSYSDIKEQFGGTAFDGQKALVVGGGRGLGEVMAKLFAANGGDVVITYAAGKDDAERVAAEIRQGSRTAHAIHLDVLKPFTLCDEGVVQNITHCFYFASPRIVLEQDKTFNDQAFANYGCYYVEGLERLINGLVTDRDAELIVYYPSTVFIEEPQKGFAEYTAAKADGEAMGEALMQRHRNIKFTASRLPRMRTDQTTGLTPVKSEEPVQFLATDLSKCMR